MKRLLLAAMLAACLGSSTGCCILDRVFGCPIGCGPYSGPRHTAYGACDQMGGCGGCGACAGCAGFGNTGGYVAQSGPLSAQVAYPYYTTRGPRDFLAKNPPSIGP
jgi:hypothetical protein